MLEQSGVIPYRIRDGRLEVLLVTSLTRKRWIIPKGHVEPGLSARISAAKEAYEEAGVEGRVHAEPMGYYTYEKPPGTREVQVYLMEVERELETWPEAELRTRRWVPAEEAAAAVDDAGLKSLLQSIRVERP